MMTKHYCVLDNEYVMQIQHFVSFAISILAVNLAGNAAYSLINVDCICKVLAEGEEVSD
jgi:hypothetical protein